jgi:hypothetical protein
MPNNRNQNINDNKNRGPAFPGWPRTKRIIPDLSAARGAQPSFQALCMLPIRRRRGYPAFRGSPPPSSRLCGSSSRRHGPLTPHKASWCAEKCVGSLESFCALYQRSMSVPGVPIHLSNEVVHLNQSCVCCGSHTITVCAVSHNGGI